MPGERTPNSDVSSDPGGSDNDISLREHMQRQLDANRSAMYDALREARVYHQTQLEDLKVMLNERYATQTKAVDAAFASQQIAMQTAFREAKDAVSAALDAAEKAVAKAEAASEKRFASVNEFRGQLSDQAATFMQRTEADARFTAIGAKVESDQVRNSERIAELVSRLDLTQGRTVGIDKGYSVLVSIVGLAGAVIAIVFALTR